MGGDYADVSITEGHLRILPPINTFSRAQLGYTDIQVLTNQRGFIDFNRPSLETQDT